MVTPHRLTAWAACLCAAASLALALFFPAERDTDQGPAPGPGRAAPAAGPGAEPLDLPTEVYAGRLRPKAEAAADLLAGRLTLPEAALRFRELSETGPAFRWGEFRRNYPGRSEEERFCRQVVGWAREALRLGDPTRRAHALAKLEAEFQEYLAAQGPEDVLGR